MSESVDTSSPALPHTNTSVEIKNPTTGVDPDSEVRSKSSVCESLDVVNLDDINRYFKLLSSIKEQASPELISTHESYTQDIFCGSFLDADSKEAIKGYGVVYGTVDELINSYNQFHPSIKPTLHITLNQTDHKGRKNANIQHPRVLCLDLDTETPKEKVKAIVSELNPHMVIESSPNKYHFYIKIDWRISLDKWVVLQLGLAIRYGGDLNLGQLSKTIRVPGFPRNTKEGNRYLPHIVYIAADTSPINEEGLILLYPWIIEEGQKAKSLLTSVKSVINKAIKSGDTKKVAANVSKEAGRNTSMYQYISMLVGNSEDMGIGDAMVAGLSLNAEFSKVAGVGALNEEEVSKTVGSAYKYGLEKRAKRVEHQHKMKESMGVYEEAKVSETATSETPIDIGFKYDFNGELIDNKRFTKNSIAGRVLQKYKGQIVKIGDVIYAFDQIEKVWKSQKHCRDLITAYILDCVKDTVDSKEFIEELGTDKEGNVSFDKVKKAQDRFLTPALVSEVSGLLINYSKYPKKELFDFDADTYKIYCPNGVLDMATSVLREAKAEDYLLNRTSVCWNESADCPKWKEFLGEVFSFSDDPIGMVEFIQRLFGYSLSANISAQKIFIHYGESCNGKSKVLQALAKISGGYQANLAHDAVTTNKFADKDAARLGVKIMGKRVAIIDDLDVETKWSEGLVKTLTSPSLVARKLYEEERDIPNRAAFHLGCNQAPKPESDNKAIPRRMCIIPYVKQFAQDEAKEQEICAMIEREASGILKWAVEGLQKYIADKGLIYPEELGDYSAEYVSQNFTPKDAHLDAINSVCLPAEKEQINFCSSESICTAINASLGLGIKKLSVIQVGRLLREQKFQRDQIRVEGVRNPVRGFYVKLKQTL